MMKYLTTDNTSGAVRLEDIPEVAYETFYDDLATKLADPRYHVAHYFALPDEGRMRFYCLLLDDQTGQLLVTSHSTEYYDDTALPSLTALHAQMHPFERDITERYGIRFDGQPWPKPLRFPAERYDRRSAMDNYPFYPSQTHSHLSINIIADTKKLHCTPPTFLLFRIAAAGSSRPARYPLILPGRRSQKSNQGYAR